MDLKNNKANAQKYRNKLNTAVHIRIDTETKSRWIKHAYPQKLSEWIVSTLNAQISDKEK